MGATHTAIKIVRTLKQIYATHESRFSCAGEAYNPEYIAVVDC